METEIERIKTQMLNDPNTFPWVAASARNNRGKTDFVKLAYTFQELDYLPVRQEIRDRVAMLWGVTPLFSGDASSVGGLTRESAQTDMHNKLIESYQNVINHTIIPFMLKQLDISDWTIHLQPPQEETEEIQLSIEKLRLENASMMMQLGYEAIKEKGKDIRFKFKKMEQQPGMPGMEGQPAMAGAMPGMEQPEGEPAEVDQLPAPPPIAGPELSDAGIPISEEEE